MLRREFHFDLPPELIAQQPLPERDASRLLQLERATGAFADARIVELPGLLHEGDLLVLNDTRVLPARLLVRKPTGGRVEVLLERLLDARTCLAQVRDAKAVKPGTLLTAENGAALRALGRDGEFFRLESADGRPLTEIFETVGRVPLPPYIRRAPDGADRERYQTIYARQPGAVAAPTAGLHFTEHLLASIRARGVDIGTLTLHVGAGTFQPVRAEQVEQHILHAERYEISAALCEQVEQCRERRGRVVAVGTTTVRALESAATSGTLASGPGETRLFIVPGFRWRVVDAMVTNFHLPESSLLMLVCAFAGTDHVLAAYRHAVAERYRFFSYGDAMFIH